MKYHEFTTLVDVPDCDDRRRPPNFSAPDLRALRRVVQDERIVTVAEMVEKAIGTPALDVVGDIVFQMFDYVDWSGKSNDYAELRFGGYAEVDGADWVVRVSSTGFTGQFFVTRSDVEKLAEFDTRVRFDGLKPRDYLRTLFTDAAVEKIGEIVIDQNYAWWLLERPAEVAKFDAEVDGYLGKSMLAKLREISFSEDDES